MYDAKTKFKSKYRIPLNTKDYKIVYSVTPVYSSVRKLKIGSLGQIFDDIGSMLMNPLLIAVLLF